MTTIQIMQVNSASCQRHSSPELTNFQNMSHKRRTVRKIKQVKINNTVGFSLFLKKEKKMTLCLIENKRSKPLAYKHLAKQ